MRLMPLLFTVPALVAQAPTPRVAALVWLEGTWLGELPGFHQEETWGPAVDGHLQGMFREIQGGKLVSTSYFQATEEKDGLWLTLRHFDADLQPWALEKKKPLRWKVKELEAGHVRFEQADGALLDYRREGDRLHVQVDLPRPDGRFFRNTYTLRRKG